ncbi:hypothetical protein [Streptomyces sp. NPDC002588]|uniref:hypothetical protein n=1 Tax=Streptomyces sp. NPDC002588 TaxID=3154419 RepID=UPI0033271C02
MTTADDSTAAADIVDPADSVHTLLWRWADHVDRDGEKGMTRPEWFAPAGELTLADEITWFGMGSGGWYHGDLPSGLEKAPVYAGYHWVRPDDGPPVARASMVVVPMADPARIMAAEWNDGYEGYEPAAVDGYAVLCSSAFDPTSIPGRDAEADLREAKRIIATGDEQGRRANHAEIVTDPERAGNALFFPVEDGERDGYEALEDDGTVVCVAFIGFDFPLGV